ncbi:MAG: DUF58 domain-containing protein [Propioniciclava sp.]|uniref:DUF58 domain-containing protein n=1 Tax=Propioniciclava sp. TaxID=2038686 RepID=UPI0039E3DC6F
MALPSPTPRALAFVIAGVALMLTGFLVGTQNTAWPALFLAALPLACLASALLALPRIGVSRTITPGVVAARETATVTLTATAARPSASGTATIEDDPGPALGTPHRMQADASGRGRSTVSEYLLRPRRRGRYTLDGCRVRFTDVFGFWVWTVRVEHATVLTVTPPVVALPPLRTHSYGMTGETPIPHTAMAGPDDAMVREYRPRDDVRRIHWPSTARLGTLMVRREEAAWDPTAWVLLDTRADAYPADAAGRAGFETLVSAAASIGLRLLEDGCTVTLVGAGGLRQQVAADAPDARESLMEPLIEVGLTDLTDLSEATVNVAQAGGDQLLVALLGVLDPRSADLLTAAGGPRQQRLAFVLGPDAAQRDSFQEASEILTAHGWEVREITSLSALPHAWAPEAGQAR